MDTGKERFERMLEALMAFVDATNESHAKGVCFGTGKPLFPAEIHTVAAIARAPGISLTRLAEDLGISKPTLSERIRKLVAKGFVEKKTNPEDRKAVILRLTADGEKADRHHTQHHENMYAFFRRQFGEETEGKIELLTQTFRELIRFGSEADKHG